MSGTSSFEQLEPLIEHFYARTLLREEWNHRAHLGVALRVLRESARESSPAACPEAALNHLRREITAYNQSIGLENGPFSGYHETLTRFYLGATTAFLAEYDASGADDEDELWAQLIAKWGDKNAVFAYYSRRYLLSPSASACFAPPDLRPFPFQV